MGWNDPTRNALDFQDVHISKKVQKRAKHYTMTVDAAYDDVMLGCIRMHVRDGCIEVCGGSCGNCSRRVTKARKTSKSACIVSNSGMRMVTWSLATWATLSEESTPP